MKARIFISSTYYDLRYLREQIINFVKNDYDFEPVAFEKNSISYNPKQSMIKSCIEEVSSCHAMILIIGNRYGEEAETNISVTRREYREAVKCRKPIFAFVENGIYNEYLIYDKSENKNAYRPVFADNVQVLEFIDEVKLTGICVEDFKEGSNIINFLKGQWAGYFSDFFINTPPFMIQPTQKIDNANIDSPEYNRFKTELKRRAENMDAAARFVLGYYHLLGNIYFKRNFDKAFYWIKLAAEQDYPLAIYMLGVLYYKGAGVEQDYEMAFKYKLDAAIKGEYAAMESVAFQYRHGIGCERDISEALKWYKTYTDKKDNAVILNAMGETYEWVNDVENATKAYERAADKSARACFNLAKLYHRRLIGTGEYMRHAIGYYEKAADKGLTEAFAELGKLYFQGAMDGEEDKNHIKAKEYLTKATDAGIAESQYILGYMYEHGLGVKNDINTAISYYKKAALQDHPEAQYALGQILLDIEMHDNENGEDSEVFKWINMSCEQGYFEAKRTMVDMYKYGVGCNKSKINAKKILENINSSEPDEIMNIVSSIYRDI